LNSFNQKPPSFLLGGFLFLCSERKVVLESLLKFFHGSGAISQKASVKTFPVVFPII